MEREAGKPARSCLSQRRWGSGDSKGENCGSGAGRQFLPLHVQPGAPPPRGTHPAAPNLENKGSGKHGRGRRAEVEGRRKAGGGGRGGGLLALPLWAE